MLPKPTRTLKPDTVSRSVRLFVSDLDGTLLAANGDIPTETQAAIARLRHCGIGFTLATGRMDGMMRSYASELAVDLPVIACNGAIIRDLKTDRILDQRSISTRDLHLLLDWLRPRKIDYLCYTADHVFHPPGSIRIAFIQHQNRRLADQNLPPIATDELPDDVYPPDRLGEPVKLLVIVPDDTVGSQISQLVATQTDCDCVYSAPTALDIMAAGTSKGDALVRLASLLNIPLAQVAAIGDHDNDATMLRMAGLSFAMPGATSSAVRAADIVLPQSKEAGVAVAIQSILCGTAGRRPIT